MFSGPRTRSRTTSVSNPYFGSLGDVWKHLCLAQVLDSVHAHQYWESHAGAADYRLSPSPSRTLGVLQFAAFAPEYEALRESVYLKLLTNFWGMQGSAYPGSTTLAMMLRGKEIR